MTPFRSMVSILSLTSALVVTSAVALAEPTSGAPAGESQAEAYSFGKEFMKQLMSSIQKDKFGLYLDFDVSVSASPENPPIINIFDLQAVIGFKPSANGIVVPLTVEKANATQQEKALLIRTSLDVGSKFAVLHLTKGQLENEFTGELLFYKKSATAGARINNHLTLEPITLDLGSQLLDIKKLYLAGAKIKLQLPGPHSTKEQIKAGIVSALLTCEAETDVVDIFSKNTTRENLSKCAFSFDGNYLRMQYADPKPSYLK